jgi:hypothetical protein
VEASQLALPIRAFVSTQAPASARCNSASATVTLLVTEREVQVESPLYTATMEFVPAGSVLRLKLAAPELSAATPRVVFCPARTLAASWNVTCPVGAAKPVGTVAFTFAVSVTVCPNTGAAGDVVSVIVTVAFTVCVRLACAAGQVESPLYCALIARFPPGNAFVVNIACPPDTPALPSSFAPSKNCTVPVGPGEVGRPPLVPMEAVKVTACPSAEGFGLPPKVTVEDVGGGGAGSAIAPEGPAIDGAAVSVAVMVWLPAVLSVAENVPAPLVNVELAGSEAAASVLVKWTVPA